jgi:hypothetical protein
MRPLYFGWKVAKLAAKRAAAILHSTNHNRVYPISLGGYMVIYLLQQYISLEVVPTLEEADTVVTDIVDTGATLKEFSSKLRVSLFAKKGSKKYCGICGTSLKTNRHVIMPWDPLDEEGI